MRTTHLESSCATIRKPVRLKFGRNTGLLENRNRKIAAIVVTLAGNSGAASGVAFRLNIAAG